MTAVTVDSDLLYDLVYDKGGRNFSITLYMKMQGVHEGIKYTALQSNLLR